MRKNKFLLNLIAATAIGLCVFGCDSSDSGARGSLSDITGPIAEEQAALRANTREYMIVAQRGLVPGVFEPGPLQSVPTDAPAGVVTESADAVLDSGRAQIYEFFGFGDQPQRNSYITTPGDGSGVSPTTPKVETGVNDGTTGYQNVYVDPTENFVIGMSRARNHGEVDAVASLELFQLDYADPTGKAFPPSLVFGPTSYGIRSFITFDEGKDQGDFVSGVWSPDARHFYAAFDGSIVPYGIDASGRITPLSQTSFPSFSSNPGVYNNAAQLLATKDGKFLFALDNANSKIVRYARDAESGLLTELSQDPTVLDPRGASIDRSENFLYVAGRSSGRLAGYRITESGGLDPIALDLDVASFEMDFSEKLADVACNPQTDSLYVGSYAGELQAYTIDPATGALSDGGAAEPLLGRGSRNMTNVEVEPAGEFVLTAQEHDFESYQNYVVIANPLLANIDSGSNTGPGTLVYSPFPQIDLNNKTAYAPDTTEGDAFQGGVQIFRIEANNSLVAERRIDADNPYGLAFFQRYVQPPAPEVSSTD